MEQILARAQIILKAYFDRSQEALALMQLGKWDDGIRLMKLRNAAFCNFRVIEHLAEKAGVKIGDNPSLQDLIERMQVIDNQLVLVMETGKQSAQEQVKKIVEGRRMLGGYHSGAKEDGHIRNVA